MTGQGGDAMQVIYMEVEGIKLAYQLSKDAVKVALQLLKFLLCTIKDAPYKKAMGQTNMKNFKARAGDQATIPVTLDEKTYHEMNSMLKKYGILYHAFRPLKSGKKGSVEIVIMEKDLAMFQELLARQKKKQMQEDVKNGMSEEESERSFDQNNHAETMEEFAENVGATVPEEAFEADMKERFGEDYEEKIINFSEYVQKHQEEKNPKEQTAGVDHEKVDNLADIIQFRERSEQLKENHPMQFQFIYDAENGKSQITEETETHVKIAGKGMNADGDPKKWGSIWVPKAAIVPPLDKKPEEGGMRTVYLAKDTEVVMEDPTGKKQPQKIKASEIHKTKGWNAGTFETSGRKYQTAADRSTQNNLDITISKEIICEETEQAVKTRVPGTWGKDVRYLWVDKADTVDVYGGKSMLTSLNPDRYYELYGEDGKVAEKKRGNDLYRNHYDPVSKGVRKNAGKAEQPVKMAAARGRRSL
ncbi:MAG: DUF3801 domain-containing protein [Roseburia sp.]|nr:DUF3801 domain-containing protein [Roseburia sp.]